tara:strand:- start:727 stop:984 length:258 start_codon:yes stop_codon:yes gene_type:complete
MPTYDYTCDQCDYEVEEFHTISKRNEPVGTVCPKCGKGHLQMKPAVPLFCYDNVASPGHRKKPDEAFTDHLKQMKRNYPGSTMNV